MSEPEAHGDAGLDRARAELGCLREELPGLIAILERDETELLASPEGLRLEARLAIRSWITAALALDSVADLFQTHLAAQLLRWGHHVVETLRAVRAGESDPEGLIADEEDLLDYRDLYNVHAVEPGLVYSGSAPSARALRWLKRKGVTVVINLRKDDAEREMVERAGLVYHHLPIPDHLPPSRPQTEAFLRILEDARRQGGKVYHHCLRGIGRDQTMIALYRVQQGLTAEEAIRQGAAAAPGWLADQGGAEHGEDATAAEAAAFRGCAAPQFDFIREFERDLHQG